MKVVLLGSGGGMGRTAAKHLAQEAAISSLVFADFEVGAAEKVAKSISNPTAPITTTGIDILDSLAIRNLLSDADLVLNFAGPFFRLGVPTLNAAIDTKTHYLDICDDPEPTKDMLALHEKAKAAGVAAIIGMGASPGLSNLLAARAVGRLDTVADCFTAWSLREGGWGASDDADRAAPQKLKASAAAVHLMEQIHGQITVVENGEHVSRSPLESIELHFPGRTPGTAYTVGHPEPLTLLKSLGLTGRSANVIVSEPATVAHLQDLQRELDRSAISLEDAAISMVRSFTESKPTESKGAHQLSGPGGLPRFFALASGTLDGKATNVGCHLAAFPGGMDGATSIPAVLAARQIIEEMPRAGVHPPEEVIDGKRLLTDFIPFCTPSVSSIDELAPLEVGSA